MAQSPDEEIDAKALAEHMLCKIHTADGKKELQENIGGTYTL